jgi:hypothetical protein
VIASFLWAARNNAGEVEFVWRLMTARNGFFDAEQGWCDFRNIWGTTRSRISFFMNKFRKMGFIKYNGGMQVHGSLLNVLLHDRCDAREDAPDGCEKQTFEP